MVALLGGKEDCRCGEHTAIVFSAGTSILILTYSPFVSSAVAKNVTRSPVRGVLDGAWKILRHGLLLALAP